MNRYERLLLLALCILIIDLSLLGIRTKNDDAPTITMRRIVYPQAVVAPPSPVYNGPGEISRINTEAKVVYLTFDDTGPREKITRILDILKANHTKAVFFVNAVPVKQYPDLIRRMRDEGHRVGNHTAGHHNLPRVSVELATSEIDSMDALFNSLGINAKPYFRFPYGARNPALLNLVESRGYRSFRWSFDSMGYRARSVGDIVGRFEHSLSPGTIVLMHLHAESDVQALDPLIQSARNHGYAFGLL